LPEQQPYKKKRLGEILIEQGVLTKEQLQRALDLQKQETGLIGEILIRHKMLKEEDIVIALATQFNYPYLSVENFAINPEAIKIIPEELVQRYLFVPVDKVNNVLTIIMADPSNDAAIREIETVSQSRVQAFVGTVTEIQTALRKHYRTIRLEEELSPSEKVSQLSFGQATREKQKGEKVGNG
jgi:hypothetical protein